MPFNKLKVITHITNEKVGTLWLTTTGQLIHTHVSDEYKEKYNSLRLCFQSDEEIKDGDWVCNMREIWKVQSYYGFQPITKKIIAATDNFWVGASGMNLKESIYLPQPNQSFIEYFVTEYNKGNVITEVMVEYEKECPYNFTSRCTIDRCDCALKLKINPDNTINIKPVTK